MRISHNLTSKKVEAMIMPILLGKAEITKTKFSRASGRVTELTAKPLLNFFFPEISFEQPLSGQFAARKEILKKINFEKDYGVDVGIVIDADVLGISIMEVDIGAIEHDMSPLSDLNMMANEVVRTIISRANKYGRVVMIDEIGYFIRMSIVGLSLIILGLFTIFFVKIVTVDVAVENESNQIRMPYEAMMTLGVKLNDTIEIGDARYVVNDSRGGEGYIIRLPLEAKNNWS